MNWIGAGPAPGTPESKYLTDNTIELTVREFTEDIVKCRISCKIVVYRSLSEILE